eukprot:m.79609 g.79609  ORF g.79609 m.79609 type:complete len:1162 (+) comp25232_c0_seq4:189-3674(+)
MYHSHRESVLTTCQTPNGMRMKVFLIVVSLLGLTAHGTAIDVDICDELLKLVSSAQCGGNSGLVNFCTRPILSTACANLCGAPSSPPSFQPTFGDTTFAQTTSQTTTLFAIELTTQPPSIAPTTPPITMKHVPTATFSPSNSPTENAGPSLNESQFQKRIPSSQWPIWSPVQLEECFALCENRTWCGSVFVNANQECYLSGFDSNTVYPLGTPTTVDYYVYRPAPVCADIEKPDNCGCFVDSDGTVHVDCKDLNLSRVDIEDSAMSGDFSRLSLNENPLAKLTMGTFKWGAAVPELRHLQLRDCRLTLIDVGAFVYLSKLTTLDLSSNLLSGWGSSGLRLGSGIENASLATLDLSSNTFTYLAPSLQYVLPHQQLSTLFIGSNTIVGINTNTMESLSRVTRVIMTRGASQCDKDVDPSNTSAFTIKCSCAPSFTDGNPDVTACVASAPSLPAPTFEEPKDGTITISLTIPYSSDMYTSNPEDVASNRFVLTVSTCGDLCTTADCCAMSGNTSVRVTTKVLCCDFDCIELDGVTSKCTPGRTLVTNLTIATSSRFVALVTSNREERSHPVLGLPLFFYADAVPSGDEAASTAQQANDNTIEVVLASVSGVILVCALMYAVYRMRKRVVAHRPKSKEELIDLFNELDLNTVPMYTNPLNNSVKKTERDASVPQMVVNDAGFPSPPKTTSSQCKIPTEIPLNRLVFHGTLGSGQFGMVLRATLMQDDRVVEVAVKEAKVRCHSTDLLKEALLMCQFDHPNIISCLGISTRGGTVRVILEYMGNGDLKTLLTRVSENPTDYNFFTEEVGLSICACIADGCEVFSEGGLIHRDLAARNILVSSNYSFKVADFGLGRQLATGDSGEYYKPTSSSPIPIRWTAPEAFLDNRYTVCSDVWSFGVLAFEVMSLGERPYSHMSNSEVLLNMHDDGERLQRPTLCSERNWSSIIFPCFKTDPSARPLFSDLVVSFQGTLGEKNKNIAMVQFLAHKMMKSIDDTNQIKTHIVVSDGYDYSDSDADPYNQTVSMKSTQVLQPRDSKSSGYINMTENGAYENMNAPPQRQIPHAHVVMENPGGLNFQIPFEPSDANSQKDDNQQHNNQQHNNLDVTCGSPNEYENDVNTEPSPADVQSITKLPSLPNEYATFNDVPVPSVDEYTKFKDVKLQLAI